MTSKLHHFPVKFSKKQTKNHSFRSFQLEDRDFFMFYSTNMITLYAFFFHNAKKEYNSAKHTDSAHINSDFPGYRSGQGVPASFRRILLLSAESLPHPRG